MWFLDRLGVGEQAYNVPTAFRIKGPLDVTALERSLNRIIQRHEILRTTFVELDGEPRQVVAAQLWVPVNQEDLSGTPLAELEQTARRRLLELGRRSFDLASGPLIYADVLRIADNDHFLLITMHHIVSDEWSSEVLNRELAQFYQADLHGVAASLPELPAQYVDFAAWQIEWLQGQNEAGQLAYWKQTLSGAPQVLDLPVDHSRPAAPSYCGRRISHKLTGELLNALQLLSRTEQVTLFVTLLAAFQVMLYRYTGQEDLLVGSPIANRRRFELEHLIGFFLNTLVFRSNLKGNPGFRVVLQRVAESVLEAFDHQDLPFERLVEELKPPRDLGRHPLFQTLFVFLPRQLQRLQIAGLEIEPLSIDYGWSKFDLTLFVTELPDALELSLEYSTDLFDASSMQRMLEHYELLLSGLVAEPDLPIAYHSNFNGSRTGLVTFLECHPGRLSGPGLCPSIIRAAGGALARRLSRRISRSCQPDLCRAEYLRQPVSLFPQGYGRGSRFPGRDLSGAFQRSDRCRIGHSQSWRGLPASRSGLSQAAFGIPCAPMPGWK